MALELNHLITSRCQKNTAFALHAARASLRPPIASMVSSTLHNKTIPPNVQVSTQSMPPGKLEIFKSLDSWARDNVLVHLKPVEKSWQPQDYVPDPMSDGFEERVKELKDRAKGIPDDYLVVLVGDMITEEALPTYMTMFNRSQGVRDETGIDSSAWATWMRAWTAEENRHGDLLNKYLYLSGRVDMKQIEKTIHYLISSGMDPKMEASPYNLFIYTAFQERATFISHANTARLAHHYGDKNLAQICGIIASDEKRHGTAYTKIVEKLAEIDPDTTVIAIADMMRKKITMPAHLMYDGSDNLLFKHFSAVVQQVGVYSGSDYCDIFDFLMDKWNVEKMTGLSDEGRKAQEYVCKLAMKLRRLEIEKGEKQKKKAKVPVSFSWICNRHLMI